MSDLLQPISAAEFSTLMAAVAPFESGPRIAVGVSGGADSLALCFLAERWVKAAGGQVVALVVDHGLRPESAADARQVHVWLRDRGIACAVLPWSGPRPRTGIEAGARDARYRLLLGWCRDNRVLHLMTAHHRGDQAETVLMRLSRGSGFEGLSAMRPITETAWARILRPLLGLAPERLKATLRDFGHPWLNDPMNADPAFARVRWRALQPALDSVGLTAEVLGTAAGEAQNARRALDEAVTAVLVRGCRLHPVGFAAISASSLRRAATEVAWRTLARVTACVGGRTWQPARAASVRLMQRLLAEDSGTAERGIGTLARCRLTRRGEEILVCRELRGLPGPMLLHPGQRLHWDGRFMIGFHPQAGAPGVALRLHALPAEAWRDLKCAGRAVRGARWPPATARALPALYDLAGLLAVPHLGYLREDRAGCGEGVITADFAPATSLTGAGYFLRSLV